MKGRSLKFLEGLLPARINVEGVLVEAPCMYRERGLCVVDARAAYDAPPDPPVFNITHVMVLGEGTRH